MGMAHYHCEKMIILPNRSPASEGAPFLVKTENGDQRPPQLYETVDSQPATLFLVGGLEQIIANLYFSIDWE